MDITKLQKIETELKTLQADLKPVHLKGGKIGGRIIRQLEAGFQKLEHFFKTLDLKTLSMGKWESKQQRSLNQIQKQVTELTNEYINVRENVKEIVKKDPGFLVHFEEYTQLLGEQLGIMKDICEFMKQKKYAGKVGSEEVGKVEDKIEGFITESKREIKKEDESVPTETAAERLERQKANLKRAVEDDVKKHEEYLSMSRRLAEEETPGASRKSKELTPGQKLRTAHMEEIARFHEKPGVAPKSETLGLQNKLSKALEGREERLREGAVKAASSPEVIEARARARKEIVEPKYRELQNKRLARAKAESKQEIKPQGKAIGESDEEQLSRLEARGTAPEKPKGETPAEKLEKTKGEFKKSRGTRYKKT